MVHRAVCLSLKMRPFSLCADRSSADLAAGDRGHYPLSWAPDPKPCLPSQAFCIYTMHGQLHFHLLIEHLIASSLKLVILD